MGANAFPDSQNQWLQFARRIAYSCGTVADLHRFPFLIILGNEPIAIANLHKNIGFHACSIKKVHPDLSLPNMKALLCPVSSRLQTNVLAGKTKEGVQDFLHTFFCFVSFRYSNDIALSKQRADNLSSSHSPSHVHV